MKNKVRQLYPLLLLGLFLVTGLNGQNDTAWTEPLDSLEQAEATYNALMLSKTSAPLMSTMSVMTLSATALPSAYDYYVSTTGSDSNDGTEELPFATIQKAINTASSGNSIKVGPGTYYENLDFNGKSIQLYGSPDNPELTVIDAHGTGRAITMTNYETTSTLVSGFVLTGGVAANAPKDPGHGGAIYLYNNARPRLENLIIRGNEAGSGGAISARHNGDPTLTNCLIYDNTASAGAALFIYNQSEVYMTNVTIGDNNALVPENGNIYLQRTAVIDMTNCIVWGENMQYEITLSSSTTYNGNCSTVANYTDLRGGQSGCINQGASGYALTVTWGEGSINNDPLFFDPVNDGFLLQNNSPCIDAGNPEVGYEDVNFPPSQGTERNDMGVYGGSGTWQTNKKAIEIGEYVGYWPFNGNANDESGTSHGIVHNAALTTDRSGKENSAYYFDGYNAFIELTNSIDISAFNGFSASLWVFFENDQVEADVFSDLVLKIDQMTGKLFGPLAYCPTCVSERGIVKGEWQHIAVSNNYSEGKIYYYINGEPAGETDYNFGEGNFSINYFGSQLGDEENLANFKGKLDDIRIYDNYLTSEQIAGIYLEENPPILPIAAPIASYTYENGVELAWGQVSEGATGVRVERSGTDGSYSTVAELPTTATTYTDNTVAQGLQYAYRIVGYTDGYEAVSPRTEICACVPPSSLTLGDIALGWEEIIGAGIQDGAYTKTLSNLEYGIIRSKNIVSAPSYIEFTIDNISNTSAIILSGQKAYYQPEDINQVSLVIGAGHFSVYDSYNSLASDISVTVGDIIRLGFIDNSQENMVLYQNGSEAGRYAVDIQDNSYIVGLVEQMGNANFRDIKTNMGCLEYLPDVDILHNAYLDYDNNLGRDIQYPEGTWDEVAAISSNNIIAPNQNGYIKAGYSQGNYAFGLMDNSSLSFNHLDIDYGFMVDEGVLYSLVEGEQTALEYITQGTELIICRKGSTVYFASNGVILSIVACDAGKELVPHINLKSDAVNLSQFAVSAPVREEYDVEWITLEDIAEDCSSLSGQSGVPGHAIADNTLPSGEGGYFMFKVGSVIDELSVSFNAAGIRFYPDGIFASEFGYGITGSYAPEDVFKLEIGADGNSMMRKNGLIIDKGGSGGDGITISSSGGFTLADIKASFPPDNTTYSLDQDPGWTKFFGVSLAGDAIQKMVEDGWDNARASSKNSLAAGRDGGFMMHVEDNFNEHAAIGLSEYADNLTTTQPQYAFYLENKDIHIYENGTDLGVFGTYEWKTDAREPVFQIIRLRDKINYWYKGKRLRQVTVDPQTKLVVDVSVYKQGASVGQLQLANFNDEGSSPWYYPVTWVEETGASVSGHTLTKTATTGWGNAGAISRNMVPPGKDGSFQFNTTDYNSQNLNSFIGASFESSDGDKSKIGYAFYLSDGTINIYEKGTLVGTYGAYTQYDEYLIAREGDEIVYYRNGFALRQVSTDNQKPLVADVALYTSGSTVYYSCSQKVVLLIGDEIPATLSYVVNGTRTRNYIHKMVPRIPLKLLSEGSPRYNDRLDESITYFDGLGREIQTIDLMATPGQKDLVLPVTYDEFGRKVKDYLPYVSEDGGNGIFRTDAVQEQTDYYALLYGADEVAYAEKVLENSPLDRVLEQGAPGSAWQVIKDGNGNSTSEGHTTKINYLRNDGDELIWEAGAALTEISSTENYSLNLFVTETTAENNTISREYKDKSGQVVLKETEWEDENSEIHILQTYYVYNDFGQLRCVIPPKATEEYLSSGILQEELCYYYLYDGRGRMVEKKLPGAEAVYMIYDARDRLVLAQDGNQRGKLQWLFTKYDVQNRPVATGIFQLPFIITREQLQGHVDNTYGSSYVLYEEIDQSSPTGYTCQSYPYESLLSFWNASLDYLTLTYYDNYDLIPSADFEYSKPETTGLTTIDAGDFDEALAEVPGLASMTKAKNLGTGEWLATVTYYDKKYRPIQVISQNQLSDIDRVNTLYNDFTGDVQATVSQHMATSDNMIIGERYKYGVDGRLCQKYHQLAGDGEMVMSQNTYNEQGQLVTDYTQGKINDAGNREFLQKTDYAYNIRGWMTSINPNVGSNGENDMFGMTLYYDQPGNYTGTQLTAQYNGNISAMQWMNTYDYTKHYYAFDYDGANRLTKAYHDKTDGASGTWEGIGSYSVPKIEYDANGNIKVLQRNGADGNQIDDLEYTYKNANIENQLIRVNDGSHSDLGFDEEQSDMKDDYTYDANGNMGSDKNKGLDTVIYNYLNLPERVEKDGKQASYTYAADGRKLSHTDMGGKVTNYVGPYVYEDGKLVYIITEKGRLVFGDNGSHSYEYNVKDHLGNTRLVYSDLNNDNFVTKAEILQAADYYPFGMRFAPMAELSSDNKYLYNGKEEQEDTKWYDYGWRFYDAALGRWHVQDPRAEDYYSVSPYNYAANNPMLITDPAGDTIIVYYEDADGNTQQHVFDPNYKVKDDDAQFVKDFYTAYNYLNDNGVADEINNLASSSKFIDVKETSSKRGNGFMGNIDAYNQAKNNPSDYYMNDNNTTNVGTIYWNPNVAIRVKNSSDGTKGAQSPAMGLLHEAGHGSNFMEDPTSYAFRVNYREPYYKNAEERTVLQNVETPAAVKLSRNGYPESTRDTYYNGKRPYITTGPTSIIKK